MKCKFCGTENWSIDGIRDHIGNHFSKYASDKQKDMLNLRQFLLCVQVFYGELPAPVHVKEIVKEAESRVDEAIKNLGVDT